MRNLIKKILKESEFDNFDFVPEFEESPAKNFLYKIMIELKPTLFDPRNGRFILYRNKKGNIFMVENISKNDSHLIVDYDKIWKKLEKMGLQYTQIQELCSTLLKQIFDRDVFLVLHSSQI